MNSTPYTIVVHLFLKIIESGFPFIYNEENAYITNHNIHLRFEN